MSYSDDTQLLSNIVQDLPQRVKVAEIVTDSPGIVSGDIVVLVMTKTLELVQAEDRLTGIIVTIPLNYHGKVHRLGKCCSSVDDIKQEKASCFSVEQQFEIPIGPWGKGLVKSGSIIKVTDIDQDRNLVVSVRHIEDNQVVIREGIPLHLMSVSEDENLSLKEVIDQYGIPQNVIIEDFDVVSGELLKSANYRLTNLFSEEFIIGYIENDQSNENQKHFIFPICCDIRVNKEISSPKITKPHKNAFFVPKNIYADTNINNLYFEYIKSREKLHKIEECVPDIPPRLSKSGINRQSLMPDRSSGPTRPERRRRNSSTQSVDNQRQYERLSSLEEDHDYKDLSEERMTEIPINGNTVQDRSDESSSSYMDLTRNVASVHLYDEMTFGKGATSQQTTSPRTSNNTVRSFQEICCGCLNHLSWKTPSDMKSMSVRQIVALFSKNGLSGMAEMCNKEKLDGSFVSELTIDELITEPFNQNEQQVDIFFKLLSQS